MDLGLLKSGVWLGSRYLYLLMRGMRVYAWFRSGISWFRMEWAMRSVWVMTWMIGIGKSWFWWVCQRKIWHFGTYPRKLAVGHILRHYPQAFKMAEEHKELWLMVHNGISHTLTAEWEAMSTEANFVDGQWTSVFLMSTAAGMFASPSCLPALWFCITGTSCLRKVIDLNLRELICTMNDESTDPGFTAPTWLLEGLDIKKQQYVHLHFFFTHITIIFRVRLHEEVKRLGKSLSAKQALKITTRRMALVTQIMSHQTHLLLFVDMKVTTNRPDSLSKETDGQLELAELHLPSRIFTRIAMTKQSLCVIGMEQDLRRTDCYKNLCNVWTAATQKAQSIQGKNQHVCGEIANTRAQSIVTQLEACIALARQDYNHSFQALISLQLSKAELLPLQELKNSNFQHLNKILTGSCDLPQGHLKLPWFWQVCERVPGKPDIFEQEEYAKGKLFPKCIRACLTCWFLGDLGWMVPGLRMLLQMERGSAVVMEGACFNIVWLLLAIQKVGLSLAVYLLSAHPRLSILLSLSERCLYWAGPQWFYTWETHPQCKWTHS